MFDTGLPFAPYRFVLLTMLLLATSLPGITRAEVTLLAYYPFEEGGGDTTQDMTGHNGAARLVGDAAFTAGKYGTAIDCTGFGDWVDTGRSILDTSRSFSIACWINLSEGFESDFRTAVSQDADRVSGFYLQYNKPAAGCAADRLSFIRWNSEKAERPTCVHSADRPRAGEWIHLAGVADAEHHHLQLYINGTLAQEQNYDAAGGQFEFRSSGHTVLGRGRFNAAPVDLFAGKIDEVYLFQGVLAARDVTRIRDDQFLARKPRRGTMGDPPPAVQLRIDPARIGPVISPLLFGQNLEHTRYGLWHGLSAQLIANQKFAGPARVDGLAADWSPVGAPRAHFQLDHANPYAGVQSQRITLTQTGLKAGLAQGPIPLLQGRTYQARLALRSEKSLPVTVRFCDQNDENSYETKKLSVEPGEWRELSFSFTPPRTDVQARIELSFEGPGELWVGTVSLLPDDHFHTMRRDVIELYKPFRPSLLRWPGGNFVRDYEWQQGLLPLDRRPPTLSTWRSTLPFTHSYDAHEIGTDEFIELCRYLGAEPCITINMNPQTAPPAEAAAWVEYCNADAGTKWGQKRAARGHREPYHVKYWFVGNEVWGHWMGATHTDAAMYAQRVAAYAGAMKKADPSITLIASGQAVIAPEEGAKWDDTLLTQAGAHFELLSQHHYAPAVSWGAGPEGDRPFAKRMHESVEGLLPPNPKVEPEFARLSCFAEKEMVPLLKSVRQAIDRHLPDRHMGIVLDEWNVWRNWFTRPYESGWHDGVSEAVYAAGMFHMFCREAESLGLTMALFFQVVNEGGMVVEPFSAKLTPLGQVFCMLAVHQGGRLVKLDPPRPGMGLDVCASISGDGKSLHITIANRNPWKEQDAELLFGVGLAGAPAPLKLLATPRLTPYATFEQRTEVLEVNQDGRVRIHLPRYAVGLMTISLPNTHDRPR